MLSKRKIFFSLEWMSCANARQIYFPPPHSGSKIEEKQINFLYTVVISLFYSPYLHLNVDSTKVNDWC